MIIRDKSKSKLSSPTSKAKIKQTIRLAMGKSSQKQSQQNKASLKSKRTLSVNAIRYNNQSSVEIGRNNNYLAKRSKSSKLFTKPNVQQTLKSKEKTSQLKNSLGKKVQSFQWWHQRGYQIQNQCKISQFNGKRSCLKYFAYYDKTEEKRRIILAMEDQTIYVGDSKFTIYFINVKNKTMQCLNSKIQKINLSQIEATQILIVDQNNKYQNVNFKTDQQKSNKSLISGVNYNSKLQKSIFQEIGLNGKKFFSGLIKKRIQSNNTSQQFYLCLHIQNQGYGRKMVSQIVNKIFDEKINLEKSSKNNRKDYQPKSFILSEKFKLSQVALLKLKK